MTSAALAVLLLASSLAAQQRPSRPRTSKSSTERECLATGPSKVFV